MYSHPDKVCWFLYICRVDIFRKKKNTSYKTTDFSYYYLFLCCKNMYVHFSTFIFFFFPWRVSLKKTINSNIKYAQTHILSFFSSYKTDFFVYVCVYFDVSLVYICVYFLLPQSIKQVNYMKSILTIMMMILICFNCGFFFFSLLRVYHYYYHSCISSFFCSSLSFVRFFNSEKRKRMRVRNRIK